MDYNDDSDSEEDEYGKNLTADVEKAIFTTLSCLKQNDPRIYDKNVKFFADVPTTSGQNLCQINNTQPKYHKKFEESESEEDENEPDSLLNPKYMRVAQKPSKAIVSDPKKPMFLKDYQRHLVVDKGGKVSEDEESANGDSSDERPRSPTYYEEQEAIRKSFKDKLSNWDDKEESDNGEELLQKRIKTSAEVDKEEEDYIEWLKGRKEELDEKSEQELKGLKNYWANPKLDENEAFLRDYVLNKRYTEPSTSNHIPSYEEIVHDSDEEGLAGDEKTLNKQDEFEHKYNFRFEEPDQQFIKQYPRQIEDSLRKKNDKRKLKRLERSEKKKSDKIRKKEELKKLKSQKRKEILDKLEKLKEITGNEDVGFQDEDLEGDFEPDSYNQRMDKLFNDDYYNEDGEEEEKPVFSDEDYGEYNDDPDQPGPSDKSKKKRRKKKKDKEDRPECEDPDFNMDCDYVPSGSKSGKKKNSQHLNNFEDELKQQSLPSGVSMDEYLDEYYQLDYEDMIGDMPCRFKYRQVVANDFGLTLDEILNADDKELNRWCPLTKTYQYRTQEEEMNDYYNYRNKGKMNNLKKKIIASAYEDKSEEKQTPEENPVEVTTKCDKSKPKKRKIGKSKTATSESPIQNPVEKKLTKKEKKKWKNHPANKEAARVDGLSEERLKAYGINPRKYKRKLHYKEK